MRNKFGVALAVVSLLTLNACEKKATGQVVAVVNGEEITQQELNAEVDISSLGASVDRNKVLSEALQRLIERKLLVQKAKAAGLDKSPEYLSQSRRLQDDLAINLLTRNAAKSIALPNAGAVGDYIRKNPGLFVARKRYVLDQIVFPGSTDNATLRLLEPAHTLDAVAAILSAANVKFSRGPATLDTALVTPDVAARIAELPAGEPFVLPISGQYYVNVIQSVNPVPFVEAEARPMAVELIRRDQVDAEVRKQVESARSAAKIDYQPGFAPAAAGNSSATTK